jgi:hypothetical protein
MHDDFIFLHNFVMYILRNLFYLYAYGVMGIVVRCYGDCCSYCMNTNTRSNTLIVKFQDY